MMKQEFEAIAGYEVSTEDYNNIIEPMYMATNLNKLEFVETVNKKRFALKTRKQLQNEMKKLATEIAENCEHTAQYDKEEKLDRMAKSYFKRFYGVDWNTNTNAYCFFNREYTMPQLGRGCTYPCEVVMGIEKNHICHDFERITLVK